MDDARESELAAQGYRDAHPGNPECALCSGFGKYLNEQLGCIVSCVPCVQWIEQQQIKLPFVSSPESDSDGWGIGTDYFVKDAEGNEVVIAPSETVALVFSAAFDMRAALETLLADMEAEYRDKAGDMDHDGIQKARAALDKSYGRVR